ncbi:long chain acyl-CoA synthetase 8-like [Silene latifolia]|uniref:long chain acyl-CoA synthetase 8-like n=1 Tax=Silene latifolia TaxID=37657 RepID=UPI003D788365
MGTNQVDCQVPIYIYRGTTLFYSVSVLVICFSDCTSINNGTQYSSIPELCDKAEAIKEVQTSLSKAAKEARLDKFEIPSMIKLVADSWTPESGLVTAALKLKREQLKTKYKSELDKLYTRSGEFIERY